MPKVKVKYTVKATQIIDWPEDEMSNFDYDNLECNLEPEESTLTVGDIVDVQVDGKPYDF